MIIDIILILKKMYSTDNRGSEMVTEYGHPVL